MITASDVARYFLAHASPDSDLISNLKLQKLVYYAQAMSLAALGKPLFDDKIEAWKLGPVVSSLYHEYKAYDAEPIPRVSDIDESKYDDDTRRLLNCVYEAYGQFAPWKLSQMTHQEPPWLEAISAGGIIRLDAMERYFTSKYGGFFTAQREISLSDEMASSLCSVLDSASTLTVDFDEIPDLDLIEA